MVQELCRVCATAANEDTAIKLFERNQKELLQQLRVLTGSMIKNSIGYPRLVCWACQQKLMDAYAFRQCFVKSQLFFKEKMREKLIAMQEAQKIKEEAVITKDTDIFLLQIVKQEESDNNNDDKKEDNGNHENARKSKDLENALKQEEHERSKADIVVEGEEEIEFFNIDQKMENNLSECENDNEVDGTNDKIEIIRKTSVEKKKLEKSQLEKKKTFKGRKKRKNATEEPRQYICDQCGNHFSCRHHFVIHLRRHTGDKQYACEICPDKFFTNSELTRHMRKHTGERPFACKFCLRKFTDYSTRVKHER
uniref:ZAD domain-containing protein n=1 Tax=Glossina brevipalpis TaxID=37001 RepID=A0A1A9WU47_9MUSC